MSLEQSHEEENRGCVKEEKLGKEIENVFLSPSFFF